MNDCCSQVLGFTSAGCVRNHCMDTESLLYLPISFFLPPPLPQTFEWLPEGMEPLADGEYDAIVMGTGLKECVISGLLSVQGKRVLQVDRNGYYGGDGASLNLTHLFEKFKAGEPPSNLGSNRDYAVDLIPKFIMACGNLTKMLASYQGHSIPGVQVHHGFLRLQPWQDSQGTSHSQ